MKSNTLILRAAAKLLIPLQLMFSILLLLRGHNEPGGGFIAGLVASGAFVLYLFSFGVTSTRELMRVDPRDLLGFGLLLGLLAVFPALLFGDPLFTAQWLKMSLWDVDIKLSTPLLFDIGVYLAVQGTVLTVVIALAQAEENLIGTNQTQSQLHREKREDS